MAYDYADEIATAIELIAEFGRPMTLHLPHEAGTGEPDYPGGPTTGSSTPPDPVAIIGVQTSFASEDIDGTTIQSGDVRLLFAPTVDIPDNSRIDGFAVISIERVRLGEPVVLLKVQGRS